MSSKRFMLLGIVFAIFAGVFALFKGCGKPWALWALPDVKWAQEGNYKAAPFIKAARCLQEMSYEAACKELLHVARADPETYQVALARGQNLEFDRVVTELLA